jgi:restriction system protein
VRANALICLLHQANYLLDRQIAALEAAFIEGGGYSEQLATERLRQRGRKDRPDPPIRPSLSPGLTATRFRDALSPPVLQS